MAFARNVVTTLVYDKAYSSLAFKHRLALLHKRIVADAIVFRSEIVEVRIDLRLRERLAVRQQSPDKLRVSPRDEWSAGGDATRGCMRFTRELSVGNDTRHQSFCVRFIGVPHAPFEQQFGRDGASRNREESREFCVCNREAKACDRHTEATRFPGDPQVALAGDLQAAARARAVDHRYGGMTAVSDRLQRPADDIEVIVPALLDVAANSGKLGDVRACGKRLLAGAAQHDATQRDVC